MLGLGLRKPETLNPKGVASGSGSSSVPCSHQRGAMQQSKGQKGIILGSWSRAYGGLYCGNVEKHS